MRVNFNHGFAAENCPKICFLNLCRFLEHFNQAAQTPEGIGLLDIHWSAWRSSWEQGTLGVDSRSSPGSLQMLSNSFQMILTFAIIYYNSHHLKHCLQCLSSNTCQLLLSAHVTIQLREKSVSQVYWDCFFFPFAKTYYDSHQLGNCFVCVSLIITFSILWVPLWNVGCAKNLLL